MPNSYIGISNVARKITGGYIGINNVARKIKKAYIGDENGLAKLIYQPQNIITFNSSIAPTSWTTVTEPTEYTATNTYGTWVATSSGGNSTYTAAAAFDNDQYYTQWRQSGMGPDDYAWVRLDFPIPINPTSISVTSMRARNTTVQLLNQNNTWVDVQALTTATSSATETITPSYNQYFKAIRIYGKRYSSSNAYFMIYDVKITAGTAIV